MSREMKHSGIDWIGDIPKEWKVCRIKDMVDTRSGSNLTTTEISDTGLYPVYGGNGIRGYYQEYSNDGEYVLIGRQGALCGNVNYAEGKFWATEHAVVCYPKRVFARTWFGELLRAMNLGQYSLSSAQPGLAVERIRNLQMPLPPLSEQQKIADYLDKVCGEIDGLVALQEAMIDELKAYKQSVITEAVTRGLNPNVPLKPSGIDWIGDIPEGWDVCRIKNVASLFGRIGFRGYSSDDLNKEGIGAITLSPSNMKPMEMDYANVTFLSWRKYQESPEIQIQNGDLLMVKTGSSYGKVSYVDNLPREATINPQILRIVPSISSKYLGYYMQTSMFSFQVEGGIVGGTIPTISQEKINNFFVVLPSAKEQIIIASYLDEKCSDIDSLIAIKQQKIEELKEYKKSVIYEYVTGKKEVV